MLGSTEEMQNDSSLQRCENVFESNLAEASENRELAERVFSGAKG